MKPIVIKVGGALLDCDIGVTRLLTTLVELQQRGWQPVLVHGGGTLVEKYLAAHGFTSHKYQGLRVTPAEQMPVVAAALAGDANSALVAAASSVGLNPVGISLADGGLVKAEPLDENLGVVGKVSPANPALLQVLLANELLPIVSSIAATADGQRLNVNADQAATALCQLLLAPLVLLSDVSGVLDGKGKLIPTLNPIEAQTLIEQGIIEGGMQVKVESALAAAKAIGNQVMVASWRYPEQLAALIQGEPVGTVVTP